MAIRGEECIASLIAGAGVIWTVDVASSTMAPPAAMVFPAGPLETCAIAFLIWLHAKWRRSLKA